MKKKGKAERRLKERAKEEVNLEKPPAKPSRKGGRGGRKSIKSGDDPKMEERVEFVADLMAAFCGPSQIHKACKQKFEGICRSSVDAAIAEVRRRWREAHDKTIVMERKHEALETLRRIGRMAEEEQALNPVTGQMYPKPNLYLMRDITMNIAKLEGLLETTTPINGDLDDILDELDRERAARQEKGGD